jgi:hypothetical protein
MDEIISYKMCAVKVRNAKLRNYLKKYQFEGTDSVFNNESVRSNISYKSFKT